MPSAQKASRTRGARRNVTLRLDDTLLRRCRRAAARVDKSLSQWVGDLMRITISRNGQRNAARRRALRRLERGFDLGGRPLTRAESHEC